MVYFPKMLGAVSAGHGGIHHLIKLEICMKLTYSQ